MNNTIVDNRNTTLKNNQEVEETPPRTMTPEEDIRTIILYIALRKGFNLNFNTSWRTCETVWLPLRVHVSIPYTRNRINQKEVSQPIDNFIIISYL